MGIAQPKAIKLLLPDLLIQLQPTFLGYFFPRMIYCTAPPFSLESTELIYQIMNVIKWNQRTSPCSDKVPPDPKL